MSFIKPNGDYIISEIIAVTLIEEADGDLIKAIDKALEGVKLSNGTNLKVIHHPILFIQGKEYPIYSQSKLIFFL